MFREILNVVDRQGGIAEGLFQAVDETIDSTDNTGEILVGAS
jgi:hypothetical protein